MLNLSQLEQLIAFAELGTLSKTAEELHISQPTITRTMKSIEAAFGVPLFICGQNKIELNETGLQAVNYAQTLLTSAQNAVQQVQAYHARLHTISVKSCAPAPLWSLLPLLSARFPEQTVSSKLAKQTAIVDEILSGATEIGILSYPISVNTLACIPIVRENLSVCISRSHALADRIIIPITDAEANVVYHFICKKDKAPYIAVAKQLNTSLVSALPQFSAPQKHHKTRYPCRKQVRHRLREKHPIQSKQPQKSRIIGAKQIPSFAFPTARKRKQP